MDESSGSPPPDSPQPPVRSRFDSQLIAVFIGPNGLRAGWRLLIFLAVLFVLFGSADIAARAIVRAHKWTPEAGLTPSLVLVGEAVGFFLILLASWIMTIIEGRKIADYGLPLRRIFCGRFWLGALLGFASITALLAVLGAAHVFHFGPIQLTGVAIWRYGGLWALAFLFVGLFEEYAFRGYALFTLSTGIGFWPAALIASAIFGYVHHGNPGESRVGMFSAGAVGLLFCLLLRRTGDLWMPIGFHAAWDWGQTYFYGVPDSGVSAQGHLFSASFSGPRWLTGGTVGPEGSWLCIPLLALLWILFSAWLPGAKFPDPAAIPDPRRPR
ncbi:MAG: lysostaphin resistance A-like protein [Candidatus Acidiferrales bacterium]